MRGARDPETTPIRDSFDRYLQDVGKGRGGDGGNYRRNAARELDRFHAWLVEEVGEQPTFDALGERTFRSYARHLAGDRDLAANTVQTYYAYLSAWCGWCVDEGYLPAHYAQRASATGPLPEDDGRKPGDQQAWTAEQRHALTRYVDETAHDAIEAYTTNEPAVTNAKSDTPATGDTRTTANTPVTGDTSGANETTDTERERARYAAIRAARDRAFVYTIAYTAVRIGEVLRDPDDPRRRGVRWEEVDLDEGSVEVYRKKQQWDAAALPEPVIGPLRNYRRLLDPPDDRWPVFPSFDHGTLASVVREGLADRGHRPEAIEERRAAHARDLFVALEADLRPPSTTTDGGRAILRRLTDAAGIEVAHPKHDYLAPHGGRRGMGEVLVRAFGYTVAARYLDNSEEMVRDRYSHIEAGELGDAATDALRDVDGL